MKEEAQFKELSGPVLDAFSHDVLVDKKINKQRLASIV